MGESRQHIDLVKSVIHYVESCIPGFVPSLLQCDSADTARPACVIGGFVPDVLYDSKELFVIGEAKTYDDFGRPHSQRQFRAYLNECALRSVRSLLIVAVPWQLSITARNLFRHAQKAPGVEIVVLDEMGGHRL